MTMITPQASAEIFAFVPRKHAAADHAYSGGTHPGSNAVVDLRARMPAKSAMPRIDFGDSWYHAEAIQQDDRTRKV